MSVKALQLQVEMMVVLSSLIWKVMLPMMELRLLVYLSVTLCLNVMEIQS